MAILRLQLKLNIPPDTHSRENQPCHAYLSSSGDKHPENSGALLNLISNSADCVGNAQTVTWALRAGRGASWLNLSFSSPHSPGSQGCLLWQLRLNAELSSDLQMVIPQEFLHPFFTTETGNVKDFTTETGNMNFSPQKEGIWRIFHHRRRSVHFIIPSSLKWFWGQLNLGLSR